MTLPSNPLGELAIERLVPGGAGFARLSDGRPVFVPGALPGDRVRLTALRDKRSFCEATAYETLASGPGRVEPPCLDQARCGGCALMPLPRTMQAEAKLGMLREALERTGRLRGDELPTLGWRGAGPELGYRSRVRLQLLDGRLGFFAQATHELVEPRECKVASPEVRGLMARLRELVGQHGGAWGDVETIEIRVLPADPGSVEPDLVQRSSFHLVLRGGREPASADWRRARAELSKLGGVAVSGARGAVLASPGDDQRLWVNDNVWLGAPVGGFSQVNPAVNRALVQEVLGVAEASGARDFLDLYCGSGNFSLPLGQAGLVGHGVEWDKRAIEAARRSAREQAIEGLDFEAGDVARAAQRLAKARKSHDLVVVDPPRAGARDAVPVLRTLTKKKLIMISCDPVTLARDLRLLVDTGARIERIEGWDMFPQTHHVETFAVLSFPRERR